LAVLAAGVDGVWVWTAGAVPLAAGVPDGLSGDRRADDQAGREQRGGEFGQHFVLLFSALGELTPIVQEILTGSH